MAKVGVFEVGSIDAKELTELFSTAVVGARRHRRFCTRSIDKECLITSVGGGKARRRVGEIDETVLLRADNQEWNVLAFGKLTEKVTALRVVETTVLDHLQHLSENLA